MNCIAVSPSGAMLASGQRTFMGFPADVPETRWLGSKLSFTFINVLLILSMACEKNKEGTVHKCVSLVYLEKCCNKITRRCFLVLLANIDFDTTEIEPSKVASSPRGLFRKIAYENEPYFQAWKVRVPSMLIVGLSV